MVPITHAQTVWTGPTIKFTQTTHSSSDSDTILAGKVALSRGAAQWLFNTAAGETSAGSTSPKDTMWAFGSIANFSTLKYSTFDALRNGDLASVILNKPMVVLLVNEKIYLSLTFTAWGQHGSGGFAYTRSTAGVVAPTPTVSIDSPADGIVVAAPANLTIKATATVSSGTITNVAFFAGATLLGSATAAPFSVTATNLAANTYDLTAVATAAGVSATSSVVHVTVVAPGTISSSAPAIAGTLFSFDYTANPGLSYIVEDSSDLINWVPITTNVAASTTVTFTDSSGIVAQRFYEVVLQPNP